MPHGHFATGPVATLPCNGKDLPVVQEGVRQKRRCYNTQKQGQTCASEGPQDACQVLLPPHFTKAAMQSCENPHGYMMSPLPRTALYMTSPGHGKGHKMIVKKKNGEDLEIFMKQKHQVGKGTFGKIVQAHVKAHGRPSEMLALKITKVGEEDLGIIEANILLKLDHPNIVDLKYYYYEKNRPQAVSLLMEFVEDGDLYHIIHEFYKLPNGLTPYTELFAYQIFRGIAYLHGQGIAHRDIKPENVLCSMTSGMIKLADFNCSTKMDEKPEHSPRVGTKIYNAPELSLGSRLYDVKVDVWSAGVVMTAMIVKRSIFLLDVKSHAHIDPFHRILEFLGSPTENDFESMKISAVNRDRCPVVKKSRSFHSALHNAPGVSNFHALMDLLPHIFTYKVHKRYSAYQVCMHEIFDGLRTCNAKLPNGRPFPDVTDFSPAEIRVMDIDTRATLLYC